MQGNSWRFLLDEPIKSTRHASWNFSTINLLAVPRGNEKQIKGKKKKKGTELKITVKTVGQSKSANKDGTEGYTHTPTKHRSHIVKKKKKKGTESDE